MVWPPNILGQFKLIPINPQEADFYGSYNKLLNYLFPIDSPFTVVPQYLKHGSSLTSDYIVTFEIFLATRPVFILELKTPMDINYVSTRQLANEQIRRRLGDLGGASWPHCGLGNMMIISDQDIRQLSYTHITRRQCDGNATLLL